MLQHLAAICHSNTCRKSSEPTRCAFSHWLVGRFQGIRRPFWDISRSKRHATLFGSYWNWLKYFCSVEKFIAITSWYSWLTICLVHQKKSRWSNPTWLENGPTRDTLPTRSPWKLVGLFLIISQKRFSPDSWDFFKKIWYFFDIFLNQGLFAYWKKQRGPGHFQVSCSFWGIPMALRDAAPWGVFCQGLATLKEVGWETDKSEPADDGYTTHHQKERVGEVKPAHFLKVSYNIYLN